MAALARAIGFSRVVCSSARSGLMVSRGYAVKASAGNVKKLREMTGLPIKMCMDALKASGDDIDSAITHLNDNEQSRAEMAKHKLANRETSAGRLGVEVAANARTAALVEVLCETDFVARNSDFEDMITRLGKEVTGCTVGSSGVHDVAVQDVFSRTLASGGTCQEMFDNTRATLGENTVFSRAATVETGEEGVVGGYVHDNWAHAAIVACEGTKEISTEHVGDLKKLCEQVAAHVVAMQPKTVQGNDDSALLKQPFVFDSSKTIEQMVAQLGQKVDQEIQIADFVRWERGTSK